MIKSVIATSPLKDIDIDIDTERTCPVRCAISFQKKSKGMDDEGIEPTT